MRATKIETSNGKTIITTETKRLILKPKVRSFIATEEYPTGYWNWLELPDKTLVGDRLSFQLDAWMRDASNADLRQDAVNEHSNVK